MKYGRPTVKCMSLALWWCLIPVVALCARTTEAQNIPHITRCQSIYGSTAFVSDAASSEIVRLLGDPRNGLNGVLVSDSVLVSDGKTFNHVKLIIQSGVWPRDGVLVSDGVVMLGEVVLVSDENLSADSLAQAMPTQTNDDPNRILFVRINPGVDCENYQVAVR